MNRPPYPPPVPTGHPFAAQIADLDHELDAIWPGWRNKQPFADVDPPRKARIKWCLKRRELLHGATWGEPRDWPVVVTFDAANPTKCYAHPLRPDTAPDAPGASIPPPPPVPAWMAAIPSEAATQSLASLAISLRLPLDRVETGFASWRAAGCPGDLAAYLTAYQPADAGRSAR